MDVLIIVYSVARIRYLEGKSEKWLTMKRSDTPVLQINLTPEDQVAIRAELENRYFIKGYLNYFLEYRNYKTVRPNKLSR